MDLSEKPDIGVRIDYWNESDLVDKLLRNPQIMRKYSFRPVIKLPFLIGVLDGLITGSEDEFAPPLLSTQYSTDSWMERLADKNKYEIEAIHMNQINKRYDVILNPFGEIYPEENYDEKLGYKKIKKYISEGGIFVNAGGYPFFYSWFRGRREIAINIQRVFQTSGGIAIGHLFSDTLVSRDFRVFLNGGPASDIVVNQFEEDIGIVGELVEVGGSNTIQQFRAVRPETPHVIPLLRDVDNTLYPIAAIPYEKGHIIIGGMNIISNSEFEKMSLCILNWLSNQAI